MPCFYAHDSFGLNVIHTLPKSLQKIISNHPDAYRIGLQGPDFLFYFHPVKRPRTNEIGHKQHQTPASTFFNPLVNSIDKYGIDSNEFSYALGCLCHFALDSECHPYVIRKSKEPGYHHLCIENEFDRYLLLRDSISPLTYSAYKDISVDKAIAEAIYHDYASYKIPEQEIFKALKGFRFYLRLFSCSKSIKRFLLYLLFTLGRHKQIYREQVMPIKPLSYANETNQVLITCMNKAYPVANSLISSFYSAVVNHTSLPDRFELDYKGSNIRSRLEKV